MDERTQARLFEPFFTTKELGRGTGLGLATVYGIVRQSGGHIRVATRLHHGSAFSIYLPKAEGSVDTLDGLAAWSDPPRASGTVLVVEDEETVRRLACRVLRANGYRVFDAAEPADAIRIARAYGKPFDLLVTDVVMPGMSGPALVERLIVDQPGLRVLYITGYAEEAVERQGALPAGGALLEKPFTAQQLAERVRGRRWPRPDDVSAQRSPPRHLPVRSISPVTPPGGGACCSAAPSRCSSEPGTRS